MCFNGHKLYQSGWFTGSSRIVDPTNDGAFRGKLVSFVDHTFWEDSSHVIKVDKLYAVYNRAELYNHQTQEKKDLVTVVEDRGHASEMLGGIAAGETLCAGNYCFHVCQYVVEDNTDYAWICIFDQNLQATCCETPTPTNRPNLLPSSAPSDTPSGEPTTPTPTIKPSLREKVRNQHK
jgi:hypothetical protein